MSYLILGLMLLLLAASVPVAVAVGIAGVAGVMMSEHMSLLVVAQQLFVALDKYPLAAVPFFILAGNLMEAGGISSRLVDFAKSLVGQMQGGLGVSCVLTCMIFAAVSGSSVATTFAIGAILIPALARHGYPKPFASSLQATSAELGVIIPPSIPMILYGVSAEVSIGELFVAGVGPGLLIGAALMLYVWLWAKFTGHGKEDAKARKPLSHSLRGAFWALLMPAVILGGIYGGVFTPTEASVVAVVFALMVGWVVYRELNRAKLQAVLVKSVVSSAIIMLIIAAAGLFSFLISRAGVPAAIGNWLTTVLQDPVAFLIGVNVVLFFIGMFIETAASIIILAPILVPIAITYGIDPVHFGTIMVVNLALGMITPPFGVNLFAACAVANVSVQDIIRPLVPFVLIIIGCLAVITYVPEISLALRDLVYGR